MGHVGHKGHKGRKGKEKMTREDYKEQLKPHEAGAFKSVADALFDAAYLLGMLNKEPRFEGEEQIHEKLIHLSANYSFEIEEEIREGKRAQEKLKNLSDEAEPSEGPTQPPSAKPERTASTGPTVAWKRRRKMKMKKVKLLNMGRPFCEESDHEILISIRKHCKTINVETEINGAKYKGRVSLKKAVEVSLLQYTKGRMLILDHNIVEYDFFLWGDDPYQPYYLATIYADLGQHDRSNPDPNEIHFIENEEELKKYIDDLIDEEENTWWDREMEEE